MSTVNTNDILLVKADVKRRNRVCSNVKQRVILIVDCSSSMAGEKANQVQAAIRQLVAELANPVNRDGFIIMVIFFNSEARVAYSWSYARSLVEQLEPLDIAGTTNMKAAVELAIREHVNHEGEESMSYLKTVVLLLSDGCHDRDGSPLDAGNTLKKDADLVTVAFGNDADEDVLRSLASSPQHFYRIKDGAELRQFMARAGDTLTISMVQKRAATTSLAHLNCLQ